MASKVTAPNFLHVVLNNGAHESVGGQPSAGHLVDFTAAAAASGYRTCGKAAETKEELIAQIEALCGTHGVLTGKDDMLHREMNPDEGSGSDQTASTDALGADAVRADAPAFIDCRIHKGLSRKLPPIVFDHREAIDALIEELRK